MCRAPYRWVMSERAAGPPGDGPHTWLETVDELLDESVDRESTVECGLEELELDVPLAFGEDADRARWRFDGTVRVTVEGDRGPLAEWLRYWRDR